MFLWRQDCFCEMVYDVNIIQLQTKFSGLVLILLLLSDLKIDDHILGNVSQTIQIFFAGW